MSTERRRGRPPAAEQAQRRRAALDAALAEITERGYEAVTVLDIARRAGASKESLYAWYGSKQGIVEAVIRQQAEGVNERVDAALRPDAEPRTALVGIATNLLRLLLGETSLALNRAAMTSPALAAALLENGRHRTGPLVERYLARQAAAGRLAIDSPAEAFQLFYGLVLRDLQIRALLGEPPPTGRRLRAEAGTAVERFLRLSAPAGHDV